MAQNIKVYLDGNWVNAYWYQIDAYNNYKRLTHNTNSDYVYNNYGFHFKIKKINNGTYLVRPDNTKMAICDWNDVKIFLTNRMLVNWYSARDYQTWAYFNFVYNESGLNEIKYYTKYSTGVQLNINSIEIDIDGLESNIIFDIYRDDSNIIYLRRDDINRTTSRISDDNIERLSHYHFYSRMLMQPNDEIVRSNVLNVPEIINITTSDESNKCLICSNYKKNIVLKPCNHDVICSYCAKKIISQKNKLECPICRSNVRTIEKIKPNDWFDAIFGFIEYRDYMKNKNEILRLYMTGSQQTINDVNVGKFMLLNLEQLYTLCPYKYGAGNIKIKNIVANIKEIHKQSNNDNATIQVASQLNCLEMINVDKIPEDGITCYKDDNTQGPKCVMCTPTGLAYRNYIYNGGQTSNQQIDMSEELLSYFKSCDNTINWIIKNGYLIINNLSTLEKISELLTNDDIRKNAKNKIKAGIHTNLGIFIDGIKYDHIINHVLCSGLPIAYQNYPFNNIELWDNLSDLFLETYYEMTLLTACINNMMNEIDAPCYLTQIGGGVFGMKKSLIMKAIKKACDTINSLGYKLNVYLVHYGIIDPYYN